MKCRVRGGFTAQEYVERITTRYIYQLACHDISSPPPPPSKEFVDILAAQVAERWVSSWIIINCTFATVAPVLVVFWDCDACLSVPSGAPQQGDHPAAVRWIAVLQASSWAGPQKEVSKVKLKQPLLAGPPQWVWNLQSCWEAVLWMDLPCKGISWFTLFLLQWLRDVWLCCCWFSASLFQALTSTWPCWLIKSCEGG